MPRRRGALCMSGRVLMAVLLTLAVLLAAGCHTVHGMGRDMEEAGRAIQDAAE